MTDYTPINNWTPKDGAADPILAAEHDSEYSAIQVAVATKEDSSNRAIADGYCPLNSSIEVPPANLNFGLASSTVAEGDHAHTTAGGNPTAAATLETAREIGGVSFDGSANIDPTDLNVTATAATARRVLLSNDAAGVSPIYNDGGITYNASTNTLSTTIFSGAFTGDLTGKADTADELETARTIGGVSFNGTANITPTDINPASADHATSFVALFNSATGAQPIKTDGQLTWNGSTNVLTATDFSATSDVALKKNIEPMVGALDALSKIGTYLYERRDSGELNTGVLAQEVQRAVPTAVRGEEGTLNVSTQQLLSVVIGAVNELSEKLNGLTRRW